MSWDPLQREILAELGHAVYTVAAAPPGPDDVLLDALLRAAGRDAAAADAAALRREWMPIARLREPAAKRALWPQLRTLRAAKSPA